MGKKFPWVVSPISLFDDYHYISPIFGQIVCKKMLRLELVLIKTFCHFQKYNGEKVICNLVTTWTVDGKYSSFVLAFITAEAPQYNG